MQVFGKTLYALTSLWGIGPATTYSNLRAKGLAVELSRNMTRNQWQGIGHLPRLTSDAAANLYPGTTFYTVPSARDLPGATYRVVAGYEVIPLPKERHDSGPKFFARPLGSNLPRNHPSTLTVWADSLDVALGKVSAHVESAGYAFTGINEAP